MFVYIYMCVYINACVFAVCVSIYKYTESQYLYNCPFMLVYTITNILLNYM